MNRTKRPVDSAPALRIMVCVYIFLVIERPWESIGYLEGIRIEFLFAALTIAVAIFTGRFRLVRSPTNKWVYGFLGLHFALAPFAFSPEFALDQAVEYGKMVVLYVLMLSVAEDERSLQLLIKAFVFSMTVYVLHSLWEYHNGRHLWRMGISRMEGVDNFLGDPNAFGASLVLSFPFAYGLLLTQTHKLMRMFYYGYFALGLICLVLTGSRSASLAMVFLLLLWVLVQKGRKRFFVLGITLLALSTLWAFMPEDKQDRIRTIWDKDAGPASAQSSAEGRIAGWKASWEMLRRNPLTGVGAGARNFVGYRIAYHIDKEDQYTAEQSHMLYGQILAEHGVFGGILFMGLVFSIGVSAIQVRRSRIREGREQDIIFSLSGAIFASLLLLMFLGFGGHNFYRPLWLWLAAWSGSLLKIVQKQERASEHNAKR